MADGRWRKIPVAPGAALTAPAFDPRTQSWTAGFVSAGEVLVSAPLLLFFCSSMFARGGHSRLTSAQLIAVVGMVGLLGALSFWAGLSLMYGWRSRRKAQALLWIVVVTLIAVVVVLKHT